MNDKPTPEKLNMHQVQAVLRNKSVEISVDDYRNPIVIASRLGLVHLLEVERVETGFYDKIDQYKMLNEGQLVEPIAFGQRVLQAVMLNNGTIHTNG